MVNKHVLRETFMKLESYDRVNVISDILRLSNSLELEFYSSVIEDILQYHKVSVNSLREELNHEDNLKCFINSDCSDSNIRSKLISTLSLLKVSNINGASKICDFLRQNHLKFKEQAHNNPNAYEEVLLIYQLANDHPAFSFDHCQEIYDYLTQIRSMSVSRDYFIVNNDDEYINELSVMSIEKNDKQQYIYRIKVKWDHYECCIVRSLEDVYNFYQKLYELFPLEIKNGEICNFYMSIISDHLDLSRSLMSTFLRDFLKSPHPILRCDFVRQFFKPKVTDKHICNCDLCHTNYNKLHWTGDRKFDPITKCTSPNNPSDNDEYNQSYDNKTDTSSYSNFNFSSNSKCHGDSRQSEMMINNRTCSEDDNESPDKYRRKKTKIYHSSGSSPINTPSDESEICSKNQLPRQLSMVIENVNIDPSAKDIRTENWLSQSNRPITNDDSRDSIDMSPKSAIDNIVHYEDYEDKKDTTWDVSSIAQCQIGNLHEWLKSIRLHKYYSNLYPMNFGHFQSLTEETLNDMGFVEGASKKLASLIQRIKQSDVKRVNANTVDIALRERSNSTDSGASVYSSGGDYTTPNPENQLLETVNRGFQHTIQPFSYPIWMTNSVYILPTNFIHNLMMAPLKTDQQNQSNKP